MGTIAYFTHDGMRSHFTVQGEGKPLIFLHGLGGSVLQPQTTLGPIDGYQRIYLDQRAHGASDASDLKDISYERLAEDVYQLARFLGFDRFALGGISMGAAVSVKAAQLFPEALEKIVLVRVAVENGSSPARTIHWYDTLVPYLQRRDPDGFFATETFRRIEEEAPVTAKTFVRLFEDGPSIEYAQKYSIIPGLRLLGSMDELKDIHTPALILANRCDPVHAYEYGEQFHSLMPHAEFHEVFPKALDNERHCREITQRINAFLNANNTI